MTNRHLGSDFDDFLEQEGLLEEVNAAAVKRVIAMEVAEAMEKRGLTKSEMARAMHTSRAAVDRLLDPQCESVTLLTLEKAARALGRRLRVELSS